MSADLPDNSMKVAIVTGAARGIGLAITRRLLADEFAVAMLDKDESTLREAHEALALVDRTLALTCDVSDGDAVQLAVDQVVQRFGRIDALINNAGIATFKSFSETTLSEWQEILDVNLSGPFICALACLPHLRRQASGSIVNITSISGLRASTLRSAYGTSKAALAHLTKQMAAELGNEGIRVNAIAPGPVDTAMAKKVHTPAIRADYHDAIPLNRYGTEEEIANVAAFLCSESSSYVNGNEIAVDGGFGAVGIGLPTLRKSP